MNVKRAFLTIIYLIGLGVVAHAQSDFETVKQKAEQGDAQAQYELAWMYYRGDGTSVDIDQALYWCRKSTEQGHEKAEYMCASMKDLIAAGNIPFEWFQKKAEQGDAAYQYKLAVIYYDGEKTLLDRKQALKWFQKSAEQGYAKAQYRLALMYYDGSESLQEDKKQAAHWCRKAYENGSKDAIKLWKEKELWKYQ